MKEPLGQSGAAASQWMNRLARPRDAACVIVFYCAMTSPSASIHGDAADLHYPMQKYCPIGFRPPISVLDSLPALRLPLLANPECGAWYRPTGFPSDGITPRSIQLELALNACWPAWALSADLKPRREPHSGDSGAFAYGLSGFFAATPRR